MLQWYIITKKVSCINKRIYSEGLYYENGKLYVGRHHSTSPDLSKTEEKVEQRIDREKQKPAQPVHDENNGEAPDRN